MITNIIFLFIGALISASTIYIKSYLQKDAEQLAIKNYTAEITAIIESTKKAFTDGTENLKASLNLSNSVQYGIISEEIKAIKDFNERIYLFYIMVTQEEVGAVGHNVDSLMNKIQ
jgi:hypothetical protein